MRRNSIGVAKAVAPRPPHSSDLPNLSFLSPNRSVRPLRFALESPHVNSVNTPGDLPFLAHFPVGTVFPPPSDVPSSSHFVMTSISSIEGDPPVRIAYSVFSFQQDSEFACRLLSKQCGRAPDIRLVFFFRVPRRSPFRLSSIFGAYGFPESSCTFRFRCFSAISF